MIDLVTIKIKAGNGGDGRVSFRREKFVPRGGPDGGDGGNGGSVYFIADNNMSTLQDFRARPNYSGTQGEAGGKKNMEGEKGADLYIRVPVGTLIYEIKKPWSEDGTSTGEPEEKLIGDLHEVGQTLLTAKGGRGGKGNFRFRSSVNQVPMQYVAGTKGELKEIKLEVKLMAVVGLIGLPNAGKSTLINQLTNANAKIGNYPFTTLSPNLGAYRMKSGKDIIFADIPGLIEGASEGKGLGDEFLRHIQRNRVLVHLIEPFYNNGQGEEFDTKVVLKNYAIIRDELAKYGHGLSDKPELVVLNKIDVTEVKEAFATVSKEFKKKYKKELFGISAYTREGVAELMEQVTKVLDANPQMVLFDPVKPVKLYDMTNLPNKSIVMRVPNQLEKKLSI